MVELICNFMRISRQVIDQMAWNATIAMKELTEAWISIIMSDANADVVKLAQPRFS